MAEFTQTMERKVIPLLRKQKGFRDEIAMVSPDKMEAVGISLWDQKEQAEAYERSAYSDVMNELAKVTDGAPRVQTYEISNSTPHNIAARMAA
jgi:hypothetical protein